MRNRDMGLTPQEMGIEEDDKVKSIERPDFSGLSHLLTNQTALQEVIKSREDDAIMAEYIKEGLVTFIGEMTGDEMDKKAAEDGWPSNWSDAHPVYDENGVHQGRWKIYEVNLKAINTAVKINEGQDLAPDEEEIFEVTKQINSVIDKQFSPADLYFRTAEVQKELADKLVQRGQAEYLGNFSQVESYDRLSNFMPWKNKGDLRLPTREKSASGDTIFACYRIKEN